MNSIRKRAILTGASQGIGAGLVNAFVERAFNVVANSRMEGLSPMGWPSFERFVE
jgi:short-subunit dehydrogenase